MTTRLHVKKEHLEDDKGSILHSLPCKIYGDESANVSKYFTPYIRGTDDTQFDASFRGYPLNGQLVKLPESYRGLIFYERKKPEHPDAERNLHSTGAFTKFTYWNYDKQPSKNDAFVGALEWIDIAEALHKPIDDDSEDKS